MGSCTDTDLRIPPVSPDGNRVTGIGSSAFSGNGSITSVTVPDSVTVIDSYAFRNCSSLASIAIPDTVTNLGDSVFYQCEKLLDGDDGIYYVDGAKTNAGVVVENGDYYYAQWGGQIATNCSMWLSNTNGYFPAGVYRIDAEGKILLDTAIVEEDGTLYYYENGCKTDFPGLVLLDGAYYYVQSGAVVATNTTLWVEKNNNLKPKGTYTFGADGKMVIYNGVVGDYYYVDGIKVNAGLIEFEGNYYYTISGGKKAQETDRD
jgi:hypothetical protein